MKQSLGYRPNVAAFILDKNGHILTCERADVAGAWQLPQGGVDKGEKPDEAILREVYEEVGACKLQLIDKLSHPIRYEWPEELYKKGYRGQEQYYYLFQIGQKSEICLEKHTQIEFRDFAWLTVEQFSERVTGFKRDAYLHALSLFLKRFPEKIRVK